MAPAKTSGSEEGEAGRKQNSDTDPMKDVSWPGIFSQHETNLKSHLEVIGMVKSHVAEGSDAFSTICGMVDRTQELVRQLEAVRKEFLPSSAADTIFGLGPGGGRKRVAVDIDQEGTPPKRPRSSRKGDTGTVNGNEQHNGGKPSFVFDSKPTPVNPPAQPKSRKRSRGEDGKVTPEDNDNLPTSPAGKRKRTKSSSSRSREKARSSDEDTTAPYPVETEDISAEVEARLMIKEASRQRRDEKAEKKRKRDSVNSNAEESVTSARKPKKKKVKNTEGNGGGSESNGSKRPKRRKAEGKHS